MHLIYLTRGVRRGGRDHLGGRLLVDLLQAEHGDVVLGHVIFGPEFDDQEIPDEIADDVIKHEAFLQFAPDAIILEGGPFEAGGMWRVPRGILDEFIRAGGIALVLDCDINDVRQYKESYAAAADILGVRFNFGPSDERQPAYGASRERDDYLVECRPDEMVLSDWLRPTYAGIERLLVWDPVQLRPQQHDILASCPPSTTGLLQHDVWLEYHDPCPWASVTSRGDGYVVVVSGGFSSDHFLELCPDNGRWIAQVLSHLEQERDREARRRVTLRQLQGEVEAARRAAEGLRGDAAGDAYAEVLDPALDRAAKLKLKSDAAAHARDHLRDDFGAQWDKLTDGAQGSLVLGDVLRSELEDFRSVDPAFDFAMAVQAYSRALERQLLESLFQPLRGAEDLGLPADTGDKGTDMSLGILRRFRDGQSKPPTLGQMAFCLRNVGCRMAEADRNGFAAHLQAVVVDRAAFCAACPKALLKYTELFRNDAAHVEEMRLDQCLEARRMLLEEPNRLLVALVSALR